MVDHVLRCIENMFSNDEKDKATLHHKGLYQPEVKILLSINAKTIRSEGIGPTNLILRSRRRLMGSYTLRSLYLGSRTMSRRLVGTHSWSGHNE